MVKVLPSLLASDFLNLESEMTRMEAAGADTFTAAGVAGETFGTANSGVGGKSTCGIAGQSGIGRR